MITTSMPTHSSPGRFQPQNKIMPQPPTPQILPLCNWTVESQVRVRQALEFRHILTYNNFFAGNSWRSWIILNPNFKWCAANSQRPTWKSGIMPGLFFLGAGFQTPAYSFSSKPGRLSNEDVKKLPQKPPQHALSCCLSLTLSRMNILLYSIAYPLFFLCAVS